MLLVMKNKNIPNVRYILDTDTITYQQRGDVKILRKLSQINPDYVATTVVSMYEQLRGRLAHINRKQSDKSLQLANKQKQPAEKAKECFSALDDLKN